MTQCNWDRSGEQGQISLNLGLGKPIEGNFDGGQISSDGGLLLLRMADQRLGLSESVKFCFPENRRPDLIKHPVESLLRQRIYAIAAGYEDCNDAAMLRFDPMHRLALGRGPADALPLASQPTLSRFENSVDEVCLNLLQRSLVHIYIKQQRRRPKVIRLAIDTTCDEAFGYQQMTFYNGFYKCSCYVPLFIFTENGFPLASLLRPGNAGKYDDTVRMLRPVIDELRKHWPGIRIELTADSAFAAPDIYNYCELNQITYYIAIAGNSALQYHSEELVRETKALYDAASGTTESLGKYGKFDAEARKRAWRQNQERLRFSSKFEGRMQEHFEESSLFFRKYSEFRYQARGWAASRRIIVKVDYTTEGPDVRYVVTNAERGRPGKIYEKYCQRSQCENWIKDLKTYLKCDRTSCQEFNANQLRLLLHTFAYILLWDLRRKAGLKNATVETIRLHLLKIGVLVSESVRRIRLRFTSTHPWKHEFYLVWNSS